MPDITRRSLAAPVALAAVALLAGVVAAPSMLVRGAIAASPAAAPPDTTLDTSNPLVGKTAPTFSLPDQNDKPVTLAGQKGKWVVLAFYPADMTSGCTLQNRSYTAKKDAFAGKNAVVFTVSTQGTDSKKQFCSKEGLTHTLLSDVGGSIAKAYGVLPENGKYARRWTFYIAPDGKVAGVDTKIEVATAAEESLAILDTLNKKGSSSSVPTPGSAASKVEMGKPVADFTLPDTTSGRPASLADLAKDRKATVVVWVSTQCPVSNDYNERLAQLSEQYAAKGVQFIGVNSNRREAVAEIAAHARQNDLTFPILKDEGNAIADRFDAKVTPEAFVLDAQGNLVFHGAIDDSRDATRVQKKYLVEALDALVEGKPVTVQPGRAFGCTIQRAARN